MSFRLGHPVVLGGLLQQIISMLGIQENGVRQS